jgi:hypothetical protein
MGTINIRFLMATAGEDNNQLQQKGINRWFHHENWHWVKLLTVMQFSIKWATTYRKEWNFTDHDRASMLYG